MDKETSLSQPMTIDSSMIEDYRDFLKNRYAELKRERKVSYETLSKKLKVSKAYVSNVLSKRKHFSIEKISQCIEVFKIPETMIEYFIFIAFHGLTESEALKKHLQSIIQQTLIEKELQNKFMLKASPQTVYFISDALTNTLMAMASSDHFEATPEWISSHLSDPSFPKEAITKAIDYLLEKKMLEKVVSADGKVHYKQLLTSMVIPAPSLQNFARENIHRDWLDMNTKAFQNHLEYAPRRNGAFTLSLDDAGMEKMKVLVKQFADDVMSISRETQNHQHVIHAESFFYTIAKDLDKKLN